MPRLQKQKKQSKTLQQLSQRLKPRQMKLRQHKVKQVIYLQMRVRP
jgi:hypothetical protein